MTTTESFEPISWSSSMETGIPVIDRQHHYLVDTLSAVNEHLLNNDDDTLLDTIAKDLLGYAIMHFETEERLMLDYHYAENSPLDAQEHIKQHRHFSQQVVAIRERLRHGQPVSRIEVLRFLNHWLRDHVLGIDQSLAEFLRTKLPPSGETK